MAALIPIPGNPNPVKIPFLKALFFFLHKVIFSKLLFCD